MVNYGSSVAAAEVINFVERLELIREGQIKNYLYDGATWVRSPLIPLPPAPLTTVSQGAIAVSNIAITPFPATVCNTVMIKASRDNTGLIYIGGAGVTNVNGYELEPSESIVINVVNLNLLFATADVLNERVRWLVVA